MPIGQFGSWFALTQRGLRRPHLEAVTAGRA